jgi:hypothetical protein
MFRCGVPGKDQADGQIDLTLNRARTGEARIQAQIGGDATRPLPIGEGMLTLAGARAPITGSVDVSGGNVRIEASFKSASRPCEGLPGEREQFQGQIALDLRHLDEARVTATPVGRCPIPWLK